MSETRPSSPPVAFVAGATGYTGREVVRALAARTPAHTVVAHVRPDSSRLDEWSSRFAAMGAEIDSTPWEPDAMRATLLRLGPSVVFALLGTTRSRARADSRRSGATVSYETVDYGLTALLIAAARQAGTQPRFVYLSSAGIGSRKPRAAYGLARWKCEQELRASTLPFTIARPSFITGTDRDEDRPGERVGASLADRTLGLAGLLGARKLRDRYRSTTNRELASVLVRLALDPAAANGTFESEQLR